MVVLKNYPMRNFNRNRCKQWGERGSVEEALRGVRVVYKEKKFGCILDILLPNQGSLDLLGHLVHSVPMNQNWLCSLDEFSEDMGIGTKIS